MSVAIIQAPTKCSIISNGVAAVGTFAAGVCLRNPVLLTSGAVYASQCYTQLKKYKQISLFQQHQQRIRQYEGLKLDLNPKIQEMRRKAAFLFNAIATDEILGTQPKTDYATFKQGFERNLNCYKEQYHELQDQYGAMTDGVSKKGLSANLDADDAYYKLTKLLVLIQDTLESIKVPVNTSIISEELPKFESEVARFYDSLAFNSTGVSLDAVSLSHTYGTLAARYNALKQQYSSSNEATSKFFERINGKLQEIYEVLEERRIIAGPSSKTIVFAINSFLHKLEISTRRLGAGTSLDPLYHEYTRLHKMLLVDTEAPLCPDFYRAVKLLHRAFNHGNLPQFLSEPTTRVPGIAELPVTAPPLATTPMLLPRFNVTQRSNTILNIPRLVAVIVASALWQSAGLNNYFFSKA